MQISSGSWHASFFSFKVVPLSAWTGLRRFLRLRRRQKKVISRNTTDCSLCFMSSGDCDERNVCMWYWWSPCTKNFLCLCILEGRCFNPFMSKKYFSSHLYEMLYQHPLQKGKTNHAYQIHFPSQLWENHSCYTMVHSALRGEKRQDCSNLRACSCHFPALLESDRI